MRTVDTLIIASARLAHSAPTEWNDFVQALKAFSEQCRDECVSSSLENLQIAVGRARLSNELLRLVSECSTSAEAISRSTKQSRRP